MTTLVSWVRNLKDSDVRLSDLPSADHMSLSLLVTSNYTVLLKDIDGDVEILNVRKKLFKKLFAATHVWHVRLNLTPISRKPWKLCYFAIWYGYWMRPVAAWWARAVTRKLLLVEVFVLLVSTYDQRYRGRRRTGQCWCLLSRDSISMLHSIGQHIAVFIAVQ